jgi:Ribbon-helix-helix protein, copG family
VLLNLSLFEGPCSVSHLTHDYLIPCSCRVTGYPLASPLFLAVGIAPLGRAQGVQVGSLGRPAHYARLGGVIAPCTPVPWKAAAMPDEHRLTIRLPQELYAQLALCDWPGQPLAAIVRQALQEYVARQTGPPRSLDETAVMLAAMAARRDGLQDQVESLATRLESLAASTRQTMADVADTTWQTTAAMVDTIQQTMADTAADTPALRGRSGRARYASSFWTCSRPIPRACAWRRFASMCRPRVLSVTRSRAW